MSWWLSTDEKPLDEAILEAVRLRTRPILMTAGSSCVLSSPQATRAATLPTAGTRYCLP